jgi:hypothetical protein
MEIAQILKMKYLLLLQKSLIRITELSTTKVVMLRLMINRINVVQVCDATKMP